MNPCDEKLRMAHSFLTGLQVYIDILNTPGNRELNNQLYYKLVKFSLYNYTYAKYLHTYGFRCSYIKKNGEYCKSIPTYKSKEQKYKGCYRGLCGTHQSINRKIRETFFNNSNLPNVLKDIVRDYI